MGLDFIEWMELQGLLSKAKKQGGYLWGPDEFRLQELLQKQGYPSAGQLTGEDLVKLGVFALGLFALFKLLSK